MNFSEFDKKIPKIIGGSLLGLILFSILIEWVSDLFSSAFQYISSSSLNLTIFFLISLLLFTVALSIYLLISLKNRNKEIIKKDQEIESLKKITDTIDEELWSSPLRGQCNNRLSLTERKTRFISVVNLKGGVGKTTLTANLSAALAHNNDCNVLIIDLDYQRSLTSRCVDDSIYSQLYDESDIHHRTVSFLLDDDTQTTQIMNTLLEMKNESRVNILPSHEFLDTIVKCPPKFGQWFKVEIRRVDNLTWRIDHEEQTQPIQWRVQSQSRSERDQGRENPVRTRQSARSASEPDPAMEKESHG